jgi:hypothetical protein
MNKVKRLYFASYGCLSNVDKMALVCPESYVFGWGDIQDYDFGLSGIEIIKESVGCKVPVILWSITDEDEKSLDLFFDLKVYRKVVLKVILSDVNDIVAPNSANYYRDGVKALVYMSI